MERVKWRPRLPGRNESGLAGEEPGWERYPVRPDAARRGNGRRRQLGRGRWDWAWGRVLGVCPVIAPSQRVQDQLLGVGEEGTELPA